MTPSEPTSSLMLREAREAPAAVARLLRRERRRLPRARRAPARELRRLRGELARAAAPTPPRPSQNIFWRSASASSPPRSGRRSARSMPPRRTCEDALFFTVSQSGRSPDILRLAEVARAGGALTVAFVNDAASPLAEICEIVLPLHAWPERSVAATKSCDRFARGGPAARRALGRRPAASRRARAAAGRSGARRGARLERRACRFSPRAKNLFVAGRGIGLAARAGSGAEAEGDLRHPCRGALRGRADARADDARRAGFSRVRLLASTTRPIRASPISSRC